MNIINLIAKTLLEISLAGNVFFQPFPPVFNKVDIEALRHLAKSQLYI